MGITGLEPDVSHDTGPKSTLYITEPRLNRDHGTRSLSPVQK